ncbi:hypothetical protein [uncultured Treponema sp.]|uniref:hypothetical protein n=1 Tax=uncultured Treponema sp. TaxID=162155 RepID=UPI0025DEE1B4|nr:hypothetical protein [uncultured Treponema sp.]
MLSLRFKAFAANKKKFSLCTLLFLGAAFSFSENFRVRKVIPIELSKIDDKITVESGINDALFVTLPEDLTYISALELSFKIPELIATWRDSVAYTLYDNLNPVPSENNLNYYGERIHLDTLPGKLSLTLHIPISNDFTIKDTPYSTKLPVFKNYKKGFFLRFMMVMKGVPESLENSVLEITAKPVLKNKGKLNLSIEPPDSSAASSLSESEKKISVFIDDIPVQNYETQLLSTGEHHLSVVSDFFRNELRTFRIEQAKTTSLSVKLRGIEPLLKILCPKDTKVFLDDTPVSATEEPMAITQGEHKVKFLLADYEIVKTLSVLNGRTYSVNLNVDASVTEEE